MNVAFSEASVLWGKASVSLVVSLGSGEVTDTSSLVEPLKGIATSTQHHHQDFEHFASVRGIPYFRLNPLGAGDVDLACIDEKEWNKARMAVAKDLVSPFTQKTINKIVFELCER